MCDWMSQKFHKFNILSMNREREVYKGKFLEIVNYPKDNIIFVKNFLNDFWKFKIPD